MKILIAPDKFKGSLSATEVCNAIERGIKAYDNSLKITKIPLADGGEGSLEVLEKCLPLERIFVEVSDPLFRPVKASYLLGNNKAYIEMAEASGLGLLKTTERNPLLTTTLGTGQLILDALRRGAQEIFLFIGGSATSEAGIGMAQALGYQFIGKDASLKPNGASLLEIEQILPPKDNTLLQQATFYLVGDVQNPLYGPKGAAWVYGAQKGADEHSIKKLDQGLRHLSNIALRDLGRDVSSIPGAGAAGGLGAGGMWFLKAELKAGIHTIMSLVNFAEEAQQARLLISGEGKMDSQTLAGKVIWGVNQYARKEGKTLGIICGILDLDESQLNELGVWKVLPVKTDDIPLQSAITEAAYWVEKRAFEMICAFFHN